VCSNIYNLTFLPTYIFNPFVHVFVLNFSFSFTFLFLSFLLSIPVSNFLSYIPALFCPRFRWLKFPLFWMIIYLDSCPPPPTTTDQSPPPPLIHCMFGLL
jgi:hypothetical protein